MNDSTDRNRQSVVLRYANRLGRSPSLLASVAIHEDLRYETSLIEYGGVTIDLLDMSSTAHTGTFKSMLAALAVTDALDNQENGFVTVSSGNTAEAMAAYASPHGLPCFLFVPAVSAYKLNRRWLESPHVHLFVLDVPELELKQIAARFAEAVGLPVLPTWEQQVDSNKLRAYDLANRFRGGEPSYDWTVQSLSGGYGPIGFFQGVRELLLEGDWTADQAPKLLGVQQQAVCPFVPDAATNGSTSDVPLLEPTLYATRPKHAEDLRVAVEDFGGSFLAISNQAYWQRESHWLQLLTDRGLSCGRTVYKQEQPVVERSGLIALMGTEVAIARGIIPRGSRVLVNFTGGCGPDLTEPAPAEFTLEAGQPVERFWDHAARYQPSNTMEKPA